MSENLSTSASTAAHPAAVNAKASTKREIKRPYQIIEPELLELAGMCLIEQMLRQKIKLPVFRGNTSNEAALERLITFLYSGDGGNLLDLKTVKSGKTEENYYVVSESGIAAIQHLDQLNAELNNIFDPLRFVDINADSVEDRYAHGRIYGCLFDTEHDDKPRDGDLAQQMWEDYCKGEQWYDMRMFVAIKKGISPARLAFLTMRAEGLFQKLDFVSLGVEALTGMVFDDLVNRINAQIWPEDFLGQQFTVPAVIKIDEKTGQQTEVEPARVVTIDGEIIETVFQMLAKESADVFKTYTEYKAMYGGRVEEFNQAVDEANRLAAEEARASQTGQGQVTEEIIEETTTTTVVAESDDFFVPGYVVYQPSLGTTLALATLHALDPYYYDPLWGNPWAPGLCYDRVIVV